MRFTLLNLNTCTLQLYFVKTLEISLDLAKNCNGNSTYVGKWKLDLAAERQFDSVEENTESKRSFCYHAGLCLISQSVFVDDGVDQ